MFLSCFAVLNILSAGLASVSLSFWFSPKIMLLLWLLLFLLIITYFFLFKIQDSNCIFKGAKFILLTMYLITFPRMDCFVKLCFSPLWSHNFIYFILTCGTSSLITYCLSLKRLLGSPASTFSILRYNSQRSRDLKSFRAAICFSKISFILSLNFLFQICVLCP